MGNSPTQMKRELLGRRIREARTRAGFSQSQLAAKVGAHFTSVSDWERGRNSPSARHLLSIAEVTGTDVKHLGGGDEDEDEDADPGIVLMQAIKGLVRAEMRLTALDEGAT